MTPPCLRPPVLHVRLTYLTVPALSIAPARAPGPASVQVRITHALIPTHEPPHALGGIERHSAAVRNGGRRRRGANVDEREMHKRRLRVDDVHAEVAHLAEVLCEGVVREHEARQCLGSGLAGAFDVQRRDVYVVECSERGDEGVELRGQVGGA